jgi:transcriptional regulator with PAS, ATPase and Fis domain
MVSVNRRCEELFGYEGRWSGASTAVVFPNSFDANRRRSASIRRCRRATTSAKSATTGASDGSCSGAWSAAMRWIDPAPTKAASGSTPTSPSASQAEEKLRLSATVLEHIADGVVVIDAQGIIVAVNPAFTQITGYTEARRWAGPT